MCVLYIQIDLLPADKKNYKYITSEIVIIWAMDVNLKNNFNNVLSNSNHVKNEFIFNSIIITLN